MVPRRGVQNPHNSNTLGKSGTQASIGMGPMFSLILSHQRNRHVFVGACSALHTTVTMIAVQTPDVPDTIKDSREAPIGQEGLP